MNFKIIILQIVLLLFIANVQAQIVEIEGKLKVTEIDTVLNSSNFIVSKDDGTLELFVDTIQKHYVGEEWGGGVVYFTYNNGQHGLIVSPFDLSDTTGIYWEPNPFSPILIGASSYGNGELNTNMIVDSLGVGNYPAYLCDTLTTNGFSDWYLPSKSELILLKNAFMVVENVFDNDGNSATYSLIEQDIDFVNGYWSSTESSKFEAENISFNGFNQGGSKSRTYRVRAIRKF